MNATPSQLIHLYTIQAVRRQIDRKRNHASKSYFSLYNLTKVALATACIAAVGAVGYFLVFWIALKCGIEI